MQAKIQNIYKEFFEGGYTPEITDENGDSISGSIASLEKINLGGMDQSILIRGNDTNNPIFHFIGKNDYILRF